MKQLNNKRILLGVTGGIAAYKSADLIRRLQDHGAEVNVVMTVAAQEFVTPLTMQALSGNPVHTDLLDPEAEAAMGHIELARWADLVLIAPASADFIARLNHGQADDLLSTLCLATEATIAIAPAMNQAMWNDQTTQKNIKAIADKGTVIFGPGDGPQACGDIGLGRMLEPNKLAELTAYQFQNNKLDGIHVVITAGPTREAIDPVRYISNHSSGKMGFALAQAAIEAGAKVTLITGPVGLATPDRVTRVNVSSAEEMLQASLDKAPTADIFIGAAAVADYRPINQANQKIKKFDESISLSLVRNPDIISTIANLTQRPFTIGFAAETHSVIEYARDKLHKKNLDAIIANDVANKDIGFDSDNNEVIMISADDEKSFPRASKEQISRQLIAEIAKLYSSS